MGAIAFARRTPSAALLGTHSWMDLLYLSFTTLSSTGLSDIVPLTRLVGLHAARNRV